MSSYDEKMNINRMGRVIAYVLVFHTSLRAAQALPETEIDRGLKEKSVRARATTREDNNQLRWYSFSANILTRLPGELENTHVLVKVDTDGENHFGYVIPTDSLKELIKKEYGAQIEAGRESFPIWAKKQVEAHGFRRQRPLP